MENIIKYIKDLAVFIGQNVQNLFFTSKNKVLFGSFWNRAW